ncbi:MAG: MBG domain-containing protein [Actinomycetota bacterium]|nr:MBG domain-containing protein [Actinomycetota bacterium]
MFFVALAVMLAIPAVAFADVVYNNVDDSVESVVINKDGTTTGLEEFTLKAGGESKDVSFKVKAGTGDAAGDGDKDCNFDADTEKLTVNVVISDPAAVTVDKTTLTFGACEPEAQTVKVTSKSGITQNKSATVTLAEASNTTGGKFDYSPAKFKVNVTADTTSPKVTLTKPADKDVYTYKQDVKASYTCEDEAGGSGLKSCAGPVANGAAIDTNSVGAKTFTVNAEDNNGNKASTTHNYEVRQADAKVTLDSASLTQTYDGKAKAVKATTEPAGLNVTFAYSQNGEKVEAPTNAGEYAVVATVNDATYKGSASGTLKINKADAKIDVQGFEGAYDGAAKGASGTATGADGSDLSKLLDLGATFTNVPGGTASWSFAGDANHNGAKGSVEIKINKADATVTLGSLEQDYNGEAKAATAKTTPEGLKVDFEYKQGETVVASPTNAGEYAVTAKVNDANYKGGAEGTLKINKAEATLALSGLNHTYDGQAKAATVTTTPKKDDGSNLNGVTVSYSQDGNPAEPKNAGIYQVKATMDNDNYRADDATGTLTIGKANQAINFAPLANKTFGDASFEVNANGGGSGNPVTFAASEATSANCSVAKNDAGKWMVTIKGAGNCTIIASQAGGSNHNPAPNVEQTFQIAKKQATITLGNLNQTFDGKGKAATATTDPANLDGLSISYSQGGQAVQSPTNVGTYDVAVSLNNPNYVGEAKGQLKITYSWSNVLQPINVNGSSIFKLGSTVPVKFKLTNQSAGYANATAKLYTAKVSSGIAGQELEATSTAAADSGNTFRYDATNDQYVFNLGTKGLSEGTFRLRIDLGDGTTNTVDISLKK